LASENDSPKNDIGNLSNWIDPPTVIGSIGGSGVGWSEDAGVGHARLREMRDWIVLLYQSI